MSEEKKQEKERNFKDFGRQISQPEIFNGKSLRNFGKNKEYTVEEIEQIILKANELECRKLSKTYYAKSGIYKRLLWYFSTLLTYDIAVVPKFQTDKFKNEEVIKTVDKSTNFLDDLGLKQELARINAIMLEQGVYYGFFKDCGDNKYIFQDLSPDYCRTRFKSANNLPILEFDLTYFFTRTGHEIGYDMEELSLFPVFVQKKFKKYFSGIEKEQKKLSSLLKQKELDKNRWLIIPEDLGAVFYYKDTMPLFLSAIQAIEELNDYKGLEKSLDEQDLKKLLVLRIPLSEEGELQFTLEEAADIHAATSEMLKNNPDVDILTTFTEANMLDLQGNAQANRDNLEKIERSVYNEAGVSKNLFATDGSTALEASIKVDAALALNMATAYERFLNYHVNKKFASKKIFLEVSILPITHYNREEISKLYLQGAQYGYSKILAGIALGVKQSNLTNLITYENDCLQLSERMIPLQSSYTTPGGEEEGGAPKKEDDEKQSKTLQNEESK